MELVTKQMPYDGHPYCRDKSTWLFAPICDGCGVHVPDFEAWDKNRRYCSDWCRPTWHLVEAVVCKFPGCGERVDRGGDKTKPSEYCSKDCAKRAKVEDTRRRRKGEPSIDKEAKGNKEVFAEWMPTEEDAQEGDWEGYGFVDAGGDPLGNHNPEAEWDFDQWWNYGGDWPGMKPGLSRPVVRRENGQGPKAFPCLGSWEPWNTVS